MISIEYSASEQGSYYLIVYLMEGTILLLQAWQEFTNIHINYSEYL